MVAARIQCRSANMPVRTRRRQQVARLTIGALLASVINAGHASEFIWIEDSYLEAGLPSPLGAGQTVLALSGSGKKWDASFTNNGTVAWATTNSFTLSSHGTTFYNNGLVDIQDDANIFTTYSTTFDNYGTLRKSGGAGTTTINTTFINRADASIDAASGFIRYTGPTTFEAGTRFLASNGGQHVFNSTTRTYNFNGPFSAPDHSIAFLDGIYLNASDSTLALPGSFQWNGGTFRGEWRNDAGNTLTAVSGNGKDFNGTFTNNGTVAWATTNSFTLSSHGTTFYNNGLVDIQDDANIFTTYSTTFDNYGTLRLSGAARHAGVSSSLNFINRGTVELNGNRLDVRNGWTNDGLIRGNGDLGTSHLVNAGRLTPGDIAEASTPLAAALPQIGTLNFLGDLTLAEGSELTLDLGADGASDRINVSGDIVLGGLLRLNLLDGIELEIGDTFRILTFAHGSQLFSGFSYVTPGRLLTLEYGDQYIDVRVSAVPEPAAWSAMLAGLLATVVAVRRRRQT